MATNRITLFEKGGQVMMQREHLSKHPPGNAQQRKKSLKSGWKPGWVPAERPRPFDITAIETVLDVENVSIERLGTVEI